MNRNKSVIRSNDEILLAFRVLYQITKLLKLPQSQWDDMVKVDVYSKLGGSEADQRLLRAYADGVHQTYTTILITEHCEFCYWVDGVKYNVKEAIQLGAHQREGAVSGYQWLGSEFDFTPFQKVVDLWI